MSDTPRTDEQQYFFSQFGWKVSADFARDLERENAALCEQAEIGRQWRENSSLEKWFPYTAEELAALQAEVSRLTENARLQDSATAAVLERAERAEELDAANTGLAEEVHFLRNRLEDLVEAFDAKVGLEAAVEAARPHTEKALIEAAMRGTE